MGVPLAIVCGLAAEAKIARGTDEVCVLAGGGDPRRIHSALDAVSPAAVLSFGVARGLMPGLTPGDVRVATGVIAPDGAATPTDAAWSDQVARMLGVATASFAGADEPVVSPEAKRALHGATGAALVDMETHLVAGWASRHGARFTALRVVTDPAERALPHAAAVGMRPDGGVDIAAILASLMKHPGQLPGLVRTGLDARVAFAALLRCRQRLGPRFALLDL